MGNMATPMTKKEIRASMKIRKQVMSPEEIERCSSPILEQLFSMKEYQNSNRIFCYVSFNQEVLTDPILLKALSQGKKAAVPKIVEGEMRFFYISSLKDLTPGYYGIPEPDLLRIGDLEEAFPLPEGGNLVVVPGLAFDLEGCRIGYGKGYYDRFFEKCGNIPMDRIALAYDFQVFESLPREERDQRIHCIITNREALYCHRKVSKLEQFMHPESMSQ